MANIEQRVDQWGVFPTDIRSVGLLPTVYKSRVGLLRAMSSYWTPFATAGIYKVV